MLVHTPVGAHSSRGHTFWIVLTATGEVGGKVNYALAAVLRESVNLLSLASLSMHLTLRGRGGEEKRVRAALVHKPIGCG